MFRRGGHFPALADRDLQGIRVMSSTVLPRLIRLRDAPHYLGMDPNRFNRETRLIIVGDASMAPYELLATDGSIYVDERSGRPSLDRLRLLADLFPHSAWFNPTPLRLWPMTRTIGIINQLFAMFELTLEGLDKAVTHLMSRN